ncbi:hypothetical protein L6164_018734 [Bauhinia variegata]|uniref:Uncharacterized protein n=1 Tax=Bauhinia variegata TaxID=167791 RepID=A0ACB9NCU0_BAUVA|nr:hypothetical protein L6164_018734 [Bauhinia variegata]
MQTSSLKDLSMEDEEEEAFIGQAEIWKYMLSFTDSVALKAQITMVNQSPPPDHESARSQKDVLHTTIRKWRDTLWHHRGFKMALTTQAYDGITHVGGDISVSIPNADAVYMKWVLYDWSDQHCIKILKNCRKAIPEKTGKVIIVDGVLLGKWPL